MRLIRDILNEKRAAAGRPATQPNGFVDDAMETDPYILTSPITETKQAEADPEHMATGYDTAMNADQSADLDTTGPDAFFQNVSSDANSADMHSYEEDAMGEDTAAHGLRDNFETDDDEDYEDDDIDFDADAMEASFDLDDFAPSAVAQEAASALNRPDPFDRLKATEPTQSPSPLRTFAAEKDKPSAPQSSPSAFMKAEAPVAPSEPEAAPSAPEAPPMEELKPVGEAAPSAPVDMPAPAAGRGSNRSGRVKTRLLGFSASALEQDDPFQKEESKANGMFPVGWLVVVSDMGRGSSYALYDGVSKVGRGDDQSVSLNFGDNSISRENHISIAYDSEQNKFFVGHSGKTNLVRINNMPLLSTQELFSKDLIRLGETTLRFVALCQEDFSWNATEEKVARHA